MKIRVVTLFSTVLMMFLMTTQGLSGENEDQWKRASQNMIQGLRDGNDGLKQSIMQNIIRFGENLDVDEAVFDILSIYRDHEDEGMRQMALITLHKMNISWTLSFLERAAKFEKSDKLRKTIYAILYDTNRTVTLYQGPFTEFALNSSR